MQSFYVVRRQAGFVVAIAALLLALVVPVLASAAEVTTRSIELSSASKGATGVSYKVTFTPTSAAGAVVIDFCTESPSIGAACTAPVGLDVSGATIAESGYTPNTAGAADDANTAVVGATLTGGTPATFTLGGLTGVTNPASAGTIFARIVTYDTVANAGDYVSTEANSADANRVDNGSVAISIQDTIAVSGAVHESLTFCVSSKSILANCVLQANSDPTLELGEGTGVLKALSSSAVSTGDLYTQISTNASSGAVVNLKSSAVGCGGLVNSSKPSGCFIAPAQANFIGGQAFFGLKATASTDPSDGGVTPSGVFKIATGASYSSSDYFMNYIEGDATGITSIFGDQLLDTGAAPVNNKGMTLTFGASASNTTPAGKYSANLNLIATGKF